MIKAPSLLSIAHYVLATRDSASSYEMKLVGGAEVGYFELSHPPFAQASDV